MDGRKRIPAFGDWDKANDMPITQYFESARQAGLVRYTPSSSSGELPNRNRYIGTKTQRKRRVMMEKKQGKVHDVTQPHQHSFSNPNPKPVDEDLYKIPPHLLSSSSSKQQKNLPGFFSCLVPGCAS